MDIVTGNASLQPDYGDGVPPHPRGLHRPRTYPGAPTSPPLPPAASHGWRRVRNFSMKAPAMMPLGSATVPSPITATIPAATLPMAVTG